MRCHIKTLKATPHHPPDTSHSHFQHLLANLHLFIYSRVFEELYTEIALPQGRVTLHAVTRATQKQHIHAALTSGSGDREYCHVECNITQSDPRRQSALKECVCVYVPGVKLFYFKSKDVIFFISYICKLLSGPAVDNWGYEWIL